MTNTDRDVDIVREATDLVRLVGEHVALRPKGREHVGLCPFHDDHTPSFAVVTHKGGSGFYKCHSCGAAGDAFRFVMDYHRMAFPEALRFLADRAGITLTPRSARPAAADDAGGAKRSRLMETLDFAARYFRHCLGQNEHHRSLIDARVPDADIAAAFHLGSAPDSWDALLTVAHQRGYADAELHAAGLAKLRTDNTGYYDAFRNRLIFPICDDLGRPIAFGARKVHDEDEPKYLNSPESPVFHKSKTLYGLHLAKRSIIDTKRAIVTEGYTDVIACHAAGITNVVGTLGTALTRDHARKLSRLCPTVVLVFDGDEAGMRAADRAVEVFFAERIDVRICVLPDGLDPDDLLKQPDGRQRFMDAVEHAADALAFKVQRFRAQLALTEGMSGRQAALETFLQELAALGFGAMPGLRRQLVLGELSDMLNIPVSDLAAAIPNKPVRREPAQQDSPISPAAQVVPPPPGEKRVWLAERQLLAMLIGKPELLSHAITVDGLATDVPLRLFPARSLRDPACSAIAAALAHSNAVECEQVMMNLLPLLETDPPARALLLQLHNDAAPLCDGARDEVIERFEHTCQMLGHLNGEHELTRAVHAAGTGNSPETHDPRDLIEQCRRQGYRSAALPRVRT